VPLLWHGKKHCLSNEGIMKKSSLTSLLVLGFIGACATTETGEDLCNPHDRSCRLNVLIPSTNNMDSGVAGNATGTSGGGNGGGGGTPNNGGGGTVNNGGGGTVNNAGDGGENNQGGDGGEDNGGTGGGGAGGTGGDGGSSGGGAGGTPECTDATEATDCDDSNECTDDTCDGNGVCQWTNNTDPCADETPAEPCTDDVCSGGTCTHPNNTDPCTPDTDPCTNDVCGGGTCTHPAIGGCTVDSIVIQTNRDGGGHYVTVDAANGNLLVWNVAATVGAAAVFQAIPVTGTQVKLRAPNNNYVVVGANDDLFATEAAEANAAVIDIAPCANSNALASSCAPNCVGLQVVTGDDDANNFVSSHDENPPGSQMRVFRGNCGSPTSAGTWESFRIIVQ
jgi:hypothetical protein